MAHLILDGAKEHYILDIEHSDKAIEIIETLLPAMPYPKRKRSETDGREYLWTLCLFFGLLTTILCEKQYDILLFYWFL